MFFLFARMKIIWSQDSSFNILPNSDRMFLQFLSIANSGKMKVPWSSIEYDSAFITAIPDIKNRRGYVSGAIKNKIIPSRMFVKSYVQLQQAISNSIFRSNVLAVDRLVFPDYDLSSDNIIDFKHEYNGEEKFHLYSSRIVMGLSQYDKEMSFTQTTICRSSSIG